jgi:formylglycine-generating enzyme required for sulfatase activity
MNRLVCLAVGLCSLAGCATSSEHALGADVLVGHATEALVTPSETEGSPEGEGCGCSGANGLTRDLFGDAMAAPAVSESPTMSLPSKSNSQTISTASRKYFETDLPTHKAYLLSEMVYIPAGTFYMGLDDPILPADGEQPLRLVTLPSPFLLDRYEVSNAKFAAFVEATGYKSESEYFGWSFVFESAIAEELKKNITQVSIQSI